MGGKKYWLRADVDLNHRGPVHNGSNSGGDNCGRNKATRSRHQPGHQQNLIGEYTNSNNITVIDGATNALTTLAAGTLPRAVVIDPDDVMTPLQAAAAHYRIAQGPRAGQKLLSLQLAPRHPGSREFSALCANAHGFSLHAGVRCAADDRQGLEQLCRYITRPAISHERLSVNRAGQVVLKLKTAWRDGTSHHVMEPMEFMQRLAALVPRPRLHLIRFHGVLAPNAKLRKAGCRCRHRLRLNQRTQAIATTRGPGA